MPYVSKAKSPFLRQYLMQKPRGMGQMGQTDTSVYDSSLANTPIDTSGLPVGGLSPTDTSILGLSPVSTTSPSSGGINLSNLFNSITSAAVAGQKIYLNSQMPGLVPGTQAAYNPGTGQYFVPTTGQVVNPIGASMASIPFGLTNMAGSPLLLIGGLLVGGIVLVMMFKH